MRNFFFNSWIHVLISSYLMFIPLLSDQPTQLAIQSEEAEYDGHQIILTGDVTVAHELGEISAKKFWIIPNKNDKKMSCSKLTIQDEVNIKFLNGDHLMCEQADIDYENLYGNFQNSNDKPYVVFNHVVKNAKSESSLTAKGTQVEIWFEKSESTSKPVFKQLQMNGKVTVNYDHFFTLQADQAIYQNNSNAFTNPFEGTITFTPADDAFCELSTLHGDSILAKKIIVDTFTHQIWFLNTSGMLADHKQSNSQKIEFSADELLWSDFNQSFVLSGNVKVIENDHLNVQTKGDLFIYYQQLNGQKNLKSIYIPQANELFYQDKEIIRKVNCPGSLHIDHEKRNIEMHSPQNDQGEILENKKIIFMDKKGEMRADHAQMIYDVTNHGFLPVSIHLNGHIQVFNRTEKLNKNGSPSLQYAVADQLDYLPAVQEMTLVGKNGNRVLFFDEINSVQMSAPGLKIHHDAANRKEKIQGIGDVRFTFVEHEFDHLKERFDLSEKLLDSLK